jgi:uncharacterized membrane protein
MATENSKDLSQLSMEELAKKKKTAITILGLFAGMALLYVAYVIYRLTTTEDALGSFVPLLGGGLMIMAYFIIVFSNQYGKVKAEEKRRTA